MLALGNPARNSNPLEVRQPSHSAQDVRLGLPGQQTPVIGDPAGLGAGITEYAGYGSEMMSVSARTPGPRKGSVGSGSTAIA